MGKGLREMAWTVCPAERSEARTAWPTKPEAPVRRTLVGVASMVRYSRRYMRSTLRMAVVVAMGLVGGSAQGQEGLERPGAVAAAGEVKRVEVRVPGTRARLKVPEGFEVNRLITGVADKVRGVEISVAEFPVSYKVLLRGLEDGGTTVRMHAMDHREETRIGGRVAYYARGKQKAELRPTTRGANPSTLEVGEVRHWLLVGNAASSVMLTATYSMAEDEALDVLVRETMSSLVWDPVEEVEIGELLPFTFVVPEGLKPGGALGGRVNYTSDGRVIPRKGDGVLVSLFATRVPVSDASEAQARKLFMAIGAGKPIRLKSIAPVEVGGLKGFELSGELDATRDLKLVVFTQMLFDGEAMYSVYGQVGIAEGPAWLEKFRALGRSIRVRK